MAFHPTDPDKWIVGGKRCLYTTDDGGLTWNMQSLYGDGSIGDYYDYYIDWRYAAYDNEDADIIYVAGGHQTQHMKLICSTDGGRTWNSPYLEPIKTSPTEFVFDMNQYGDKLLIYSQSDVYEVSKAELLSEGTGLEGVKSEKLKAQNEVYDLSGREIRCTLPRSIYIQDGKKIVK